MQKEIIDIYFNISFSIPIVLVLEPSSEEDWSKTYRIVDELIQALPGRIEGFYFMGSTKYYPISSSKDFKENIPVWFQENKDRITLISQIFEKLKEEGFSGMIGAICSKPPLDIDDCNNTEALERMLFIKTEDEQLSQNFIEIDGRLRINRIIEALDNPVKEIFLKGRGFVPICYEVKPKSKVEVIFKDGEFNLTISPSVDGLQLHIRGLCKNVHPSLYIKRNKNKHVEIRKGEKEEPPWFDEPEWRSLPENLKSIIEAGILKQDFKCKQCGKNHTFNSLHCPEGDLILKGLPLNTCHLFSHEKSLALSNNWYAYPLKNNQRIVNKEGNLFEWHDNRWKFIGEITPFDEIANDVWGLFHRI